MRTVKELEVTLDKHESREEKLKVLYQWVKQNTVKFKTFCHLLLYIYIEKEEEL